MSQPELTLLIGQLIHARMKIRIQDRNQNQKPKPNPKPKPKSPRQGPESLQTQSESESESESGLGIGLGIGGLIWSPYANQAGDTVTVWTMNFSPFVFMEISGIMQNAHPPTHSSPCVFVF